MNDTREKKGKVVFFADKKGEFRWRLKASNGNVIADSGEGYKSQESCKNGFDSVKHFANNSEEIYEW